MQRQVFRHLGSFSGHVAVGPSLTVLGPACCAGTVQIPLPLSKRPVCTKGRGSRRQQLATVTEQHVTRAPVPVGPLPLPQLGALPWQV